MNTSNLPDLDFIVRQALKEDHAHKDITTQTLIGPSESASARIVAKEDAMVCGLPIACRVFQELDKNVRCDTVWPEGKLVKKGATLLVIKGKARALLSGERTALNFLGYLSGIATNANRYVQAVHPYKVQILDTRKTTPGLRELEKYAVRCGGAVNHRMNLEDMIFIKDNHRWINRNRMTLEKMVSSFKNRAVELEVDTLSEFKEALMTRANVILLDNMSCSLMKQAVALRNKKTGSKRPLLEASGGITLKNIRTIAQTGVDRISIGALTHSHQSVDISMELINA